MTTISSSPPEVRRTRASRAPRPAVTRFRGELARVLMLLHGVLTREEMGDHIEIL